MHDAFFECIRPAAARVECEGHAVLTCSAHVWEVVSAHSREGHSVTMHDDVTTGHCSESVAPAQLEVTV